MLTNVLPVGTIQATPPLEQLTPPKKESRGPDNSLEAKCELPTLPAITASAKDVIEYGIKVQEHRVCMHEREQREGAERRREEDKRKQQEEEKRLERLAKAGKRSVFIGYRYVFDPQDLDSHCIHFAYRGKKPLLFLHGDICMATEDLGGEERAKRISLGEFIGGAEPDKKRLASYNVAVGVVYTPSFLSFNPTSWLDIEGGASGNIGFQVRVWHDQYKLEVAKRPEDITTPKEIAIDPRSEMVVHTRIGFDVGAVQLEVGAGIGYVFRINTNTNDTSHGFIVTPFLGLGLSDSQNNGNDQ